MNTSLAMNKHTLEKIRYPFSLGMKKIRYHLTSDKRLIRRKYKKILGRFPELEHPSLFSEKLQWLKLYDRNPLMTICADKYRVRQYIKENIGEEYLIPLVFDSANPDDIYPENLPDFPVVIKQNHDSGYAMTFVHDKSKVDFEAVRTRLKKGAKINYFWGKREWSYKNIKPHIVVEKMMFDGEGNLPDDYKIHCFNGKVQFVELMTERFSSTGVKEHCLLRDGTKADFVFSYPQTLKPFEKPAEWEEMMQLAEKLAEVFRYVRVDLYNIAGKIYFGELTFYPHSGWNMLLQPREWDLKLGKLLTLPSDD